MAGQPFHHLPAPMAQRSGEHPKLSGAAAGLAAQRQCADDQQGIWPADRPCRKAKSGCRAATGNGPCMGKGHPAADEALPLSPVGAGPEYLRHDPPVPAADGRTDRASASIGRALGRCSSAIGRRAGGDSPCASSRAAVAGR